VKAQHARQSGPLALETKRIEEGFERRARRDEMMEYAHSWGEQLFNEKKK